MNCSTPGLPVHHQLPGSPKPMSIESVMPSNHLILCRPLLLLPSIFPSIRVFSNESALCIRWPKYWSFSCSISPFNEHPGLISFRMDWLDLFAVQGTLKSLLQHHSSKASILWHSAFLIFPLSHPYMITGKTIALTRRTFVDKVMSRLFNTQSRLVITFLPRSKCLLISWLQSPSAVTLEPPKIRSATVSTLCHEVMGSDIIWYLSFSLRLTSFSMVVSRSFHVAANSLMKKEWNKLPYCYFNSYYLNIKIPLEGILLWFQLRILSWGIWMSWIWIIYLEWMTKSGKLSSGHRTGKGQFSFQSQRKALPKNAQTTAQLHSSHMLAK